VILIEIFPAKNAKSLSVITARPASRRTVRGKARRGSPAIEGCRQSLQSLVAEKEVLEPCTSFVPDFVATLMMLEEERPTSAVNLVAI